MNRFMKRVLSGDIDDGLLEMMGLARRRQAIGLVLPAIGLLIAGGAIGAGLGLVFAPASGRRMREQVEERVGRLRDRFNKNSAGSEMGSNNHV
jgi:hypothetical protein